MACFFASAFLSLHAQQKIIRGHIKDDLNDERIPFASVQFMKAGVGKLSDSAGNFRFAFNSWPSDTLIVTYVGYRDFKIAINADILSQAGKDTLYLVLQLERGKYAQEVIVKRKIDRGLLLWRRIVKRKPFNDRNKFENFSYELYNKLELDLNRLKFDKLKEWRLLKPFKSIIEEHVDTSEGPAFLPVYLTETISDFYFQKSPRLTREIIKGSKTMGIDNESVTKFLGGTDQNVNVYNNFIPVFDKQFVSPISDNGDAYYRYKLMDTQYVNGQRLIHLAFYPKRKAENTFEGDCWIHDTTFAVQKMNLFLAKEANINFVEKLSIIQEYAQLPDSVWFLAKDKFVVDIAPIGKSLAGAIGRKTTTYRNIRINDTATIAQLKKNKLKEEIIILEGAREKEDVYWKDSRHENLTKTEQSIYSMIDTLRKMPIFKKYTDRLNFLATGYYEIGNYEIGPWFNWITGNSLEGTRVRFDLGTNKGFNKNLFLHGYLAYGFGDRTYKYKLDGMYLFSRHPRSSIYASYTKDLDNGQTYYDEISTDNIFALAVRKPGIPLKFMQIDEKRIDFYKSWDNGFAATLSTVHKQFDPLRNLPPKFIFPSPNGESLNNFEVSLKLRYAYLERFFETYYNRYSLGSPYPITEIKISKGIVGVFNSSYDYTKVYLSVSDFIKIAPLGSLYYNMFAGKIYGTLPYMLLEVHPGNEIYYYNKYAFNLMNRYEYISDQYAGFNVEHNIGNGLFKYIPITRKLKFRQFWSAKGLIGKMSDANYALNVNNPYNSFQTLNGKTYIEVGTGVDNILKVFRIDFVWRLTPRPLPKEQIKRFGIFGSFRLAF
ncbi:MAG: DUF5686 family protein [Chitinophagaceae bacterium]